jgi:hypothetical protein
MRLVLLLNHLRCRDAAERPGRPSNGRTVVAVALGSGRQAFRYESGLRAAKADRRPSGRLALARPETNSSRTIAYVRGGEKSCPAGAVARRRRSGRVIFKTAVAPLHRTRIIISIRLHDSRISVPSSRPDTTPVVSTPDASRPAGVEQTRAASLRDHHH